MKLIVILIIALSVCFGKELPPDPLENPRLFGYSLSIGIRVVENVRYCTVNVEISQDLLDALRKRDGGGLVPHLVLRKKVPGMPGFPAHPTIFQMERSAKKAWLKGHVAYEVTMRYDYLYGGKFDIQSMAVELLPPRVAGRTREKSVI